MSGTARSSGSIAGCYLAPVGIEPPRPADRYRARVVARSGRSVATTVSHLSALAVHRLPIDGADLSRVHVTRDGPNGGLWKQATSGMRAPSRSPTGPRSRVSG